LLNCRFAEKQVSSGNANNLVQGKYPPLLRHGCMRVKTQKKKGGITMNIYVVAIVAIVAVAIVAVVGLVCRSPDDTQLKINSRIIVMLVDKKKNR